MALTGAIDIVRAGPGELKLLFNPSQAGALLLLGLTVLFLVLAFVFSGKKSVLIIMLLAAVFCGFNAMSSWSYRGVAVLSTASQTLVVTEKSFYYDHTNTYPLAAVESAVVQNGRYQNRRFAFVLGSGQVLPVGDYRGGESFYGAAEAVNTFMREGRTVGK